MLDLSAPLAIHSKNLPRNPEFRDSFRESVDCETGLRSIDLSAYLLSGGLFLIGFPPVFKHVLFVAPVMFYFFTFIYFEAMLIIHRRKKFSVRMGQKHCRHIFIHKGLIGGKFDICHSFCYLDGPLMGMA